MNTPKQDDKHPANKELLKQRAGACGPGCGCHTAGTAGNRRWVIGALVLVAAGVLVARAMIKNNGTPTLASTTAFAESVAAQSAAGTGDPVTKSEVAAPATETSVGRTVGGLSELDSIAANTDAVFIFLPGKEKASGNPPSAPMRGAARMIESRAAMKCGLFTLKTGTRDYDQIAAQMSVPGVLAIVKGRGMSAVSGEITESKLLQGYLAASSASGCGPAAGSGCCPK